MKPLLTILIILTLSNGVSAQMKFHWRQYSGPITTTIQNPDSPKTEATGLNKVGIYGYELQVSNDIGSGFDSCLVTVISGALGIHVDTVYHLQRPKITKLEIKAIVRSGDIFLQIKSPRQQEMSCMICDILGRGIGKINFRVKEGFNFISIPKPQIRGVYILRFITYWEGITEKIFV